MKILIVEDRPLRSPGLSLVIRELYPDSQIHECGSIAEGMAALDQPTVLVLFFDRDNVHQVNLTRIKSLKSGHENMHLLILSSFDEQIFALPFVHAGVDGFLSSSASREEIRNAFSSITKGHRYVSDRIMDILLQNEIEFKSHNRDPFKSLSSRERQIMALLVENKTPTQIAQLLDIKAGTISLHKHRILKKMEVSTLKRLIEKVTLLS